MKKLLALIAIGASLAIGLQADEPAAPASGDNTTEVTFTYTPSRREAKSVTEVTVAGAFNGWDAYATEMKKGEDGVWSVKVKMPKGAGQWKFLVNGNWIQNMEPIADRITPKPDRFVNDPYGGKNCENDF